MFNFRLHKVSVFTFFLLISFNSGDGGLAVYSPYVILSICFFSFLLLRFIFKSKTILNKEKLFFSLFYLFTTIVHIIVSNSSVDTFFRNFVILVCLFLSIIPNKKNSIFIIKTILFVMFSELIIRILINNLTFYGFKKSLIFPDTNFLGIFFVPIVVVCWEFFKISERIKSLLVLILTMSRTTWIALVSLSIFYKRRNLTYLAFAFFLLGPFFLFSYYSEELREIDGSLSTKIDIFLALVSIEENFLKILFFGLGRVEAQEVAADILGRSVYTGHTIPGNIFQYGLVNLFSFVLISISFVNKKYKLFFLAYLLVTGMTGLFPYSYLPLTIYGLNAASFVNK
jgi:hypothetical protein